jgi:hypothetical protein
MMCILYAELKISWLQKTNLIRGNFDSLHVCTRENISTGWAKRLAVSPAQPRRAETRRSAGKAAASDAD